MTKKGQKMSFHARQVEIVAKMRIMEIALISQNSKKKILLIKWRENFMKLMLMPGYLSIFSGIEISIFRDVLPDAVCRFAKIATNEKLGLAVRWEHRSFKEQGIDKEPTIHIGAVAGVLERKGIQTERGNINREIVKRNMMLEQAEKMFELAKQKVQRIQYSRYENAAGSVENEA